MLAGCSVMAPKGRVCQCGRALSVKSGRQSAGDDTTGANVGERDTMTKVEVDAKDLAKVYDMATFEHEDTREQIDSGDLPESVESRLEGMHTLQGYALDNVKEALQEQTDLDIED